MSNWTNLHEVIQDLEIAQGGAVPARLQVITGDGPPPLNMPDEESMPLSKYDLESDCLGAGDLPPPDFKQIQKMLDMVKNQEQEPVSSSELNLTSPEFIPPHQKKIKRERNVALLSIIKNKEAELATRRPLPNSIIPAMFKRKSLNNEGNISPSPSSTSQTSQTSPPNKSKLYIPSARAKEYYNKYLENSNTKEQMEQDIWNRLEKQIKEVDTRKKMEADLSPQERGNTSPHDVACAAFDVKLSEHRHQLPGDCIVCVVAAKHGYYF